MSEFANKNPDRAGESAPERMQQTTEDRLAADVAAADVAATRRQEQAPPYAVPRTGLAATDLGLGLKPGRRPDVVKSRVERHSR